MSTRDCPFCRVIAGELAGEILDEDERTIAFMASEPATRGHALVVPRCHAPDLLGIADDDLAAAVAGAMRLAARAVDRLGADGVNVINGCGRAAWQTVPHFHIHVIPRYAGDQLRLALRSPSAGPEDIAAVAAVLR